MTISWASCVLRIEVGTKVDLLCDFEGAWEVVVVVVVDLGVEGWGVALFLGGILVRNWWWLFERLEIS